MFQILNNDRPVRVNIPTQKRARTMLALLKATYPKANLRIVSSDASTNF